MEIYQKHPLKLYIQDIFRAEQAEGSKYIYKLFGYKFKNIMIHGVVTSVYNKTEKTTNLEISDPTGCIQVYYDSTKNNTNKSKNQFKHLVHSLSVASRSNNDNATTMAKLLNSIEKKHRNPIDFQAGSFISVVGDIFVDSLKNVRMVSAYQCRTTSSERDTIWLEELRYLYDKYYIKNKDMIKT